MSHNRFPAYIRILLLLCAAGGGLHMHLKCSPDVEYIFEIHGPGAIESPGPSFSGPR